MIRASFHRPVVVKNIVDEGSTINKSANDNDRLVIRMKYTIKNLLRFRHPSFGFLITRHDTHPFNFTKRGTYLSYLIIRNNLVYSHGFEWVKLHCVVLDSKCSFHFDTRLLYSHLKCFVIPNCYKLFRRRRKKWQEK